MNSSEALRFFRRNRKFTQKELLSVYNSSTYSRLESGKRPIKLEELGDILKSLSVSPEEFLSHVAVDSEQGKFRELYQACQKNQNNPKKKLKLCTYYTQLKAISMKSLQQLTNYIAIKVFFAEHWNEIEAVTNEEIAYLYNYFMQKNYYIQCDYELMVNTIFLYTSEQMDQIIAKAIPIKGEQNRDERTKKLADSLIINAISSKLHKKELEKADYYLKLAKEQNEHKVDYSYGLTLQYLTNLLNFLKSGDFIFLEKIHDYLNLIRDMGDSLLTKQIETEIRTLTFDPVQAKDRSLSLTESN